MFIDKLKQLFTQNLAQDKVASCKQNINFRELGKASKMTLGRGGAFVEGTRGQRWEP